MFKLYPLAGKNYFWNLAAVKFLNKHLIFSATPGKGHLFLNNFVYRISLYP